MKIRILSMLLVICMLMGMMTFPAVAETAISAASPSTVSPLTREEAKALTADLYTGAGTKTDLYPAYNNCWFMAVSDTTWGAWTTFRGNLEANGFVKIESHQVLDADWEEGTDAHTYRSAFATYANDDYVITTFHNKSGAYNPSGKRVVYINIEPRDMSLEVFKAPETVTHVCDPMLIQIGLDVNTDVNKEDTARSGMSYAMRLSDGRFIVYDGGIGYDATVQNADRLYAVLKKYAPDTGAYAGKVVIATWVITHPHIDHIGAFNDFTSRYIGYEGAPVTLESVIAYLPTCADTSSENASAIVPSGKDVNSEKIAPYNNILLSVEAMGVDVYKAHVGQKYHFNEATVEILFSPEALYYYTTDKKEQPTGDGNYLSIISCVRWNTETQGSYAAIITGDATYHGINYVNEVFGEQLKAKIVRNSSGALANTNFVQTPHHGCISDYHKDATHVSALSTFYKTVNSQKHLMPSGIRWGGINIGVITTPNASYTDDSRLIGYAKTAGNPTVGLSNVYIAGASVQPFTLGWSTRGVTPEETYPISSLDVAGAAVPVKSGSTYLLYNEVGMNMIERGNNYKLQKDMTFKVIPGETSFPLCAELYHNTLDGNGKTVTISSDGAIDLPMEDSLSGLLFSSLGEVVYKYNNNKSSVIASKYNAATHGAVTSVTEKNATIKNLTIHCDDIHVTGSKSGQIGILSANTTGKLTLTNVTLQAGTITDLSSSTTNIGLMIGKVMHGLTAENCHINGSIVASEASVTRSGGMLGAVELKENSLTDVSNKSLDDALLWDISLSDCTVNQTNAAGEIEGSALAGGMIGSVRTSTSAGDRPISMTRCNVYGAVKAGEDAGGLLGTMTRATTLKAQTCALSVTATATRAGAAIGNIYTGSTVTLTNCTTTGNELVGAGNASLKDWNVLKEQGIHLTELFQTLEGARVRMYSNDQDNSGLRFDIAIDKEMLDMLTAAGYTVSVGSMMVKSDALTGEFTMPALDAKDITYTKAENTYAEMQTNGMLRQNAAGKWFYSAARIGIPNGDYAVDYSCIGYLTLTKGSTTYTLYSGFDKTQNSRNIKSVAAAALADTAADYSAYETVLKTFAGLS